MRSFSKKLAFVLAAAMVVTSFAPAASAKAAGEMAINKSSQILYVNEGINHKGAEGVAAGKGNVSVYDFSVKNKPADWKDTLSFKWTSSDEDVVTVKAGGVATAVSVGKATITCKVTDKATKETVATLKTKITVKANADEVEIINADDVAGLAYEVGATVDLNRAMYDENGNRTTKRGTVVTDYTRWIAEPSNGVTIDQKSGKYTFAEAGEFTLYCETYQSSKYTKTTATSEKITVTVADSSVELKQTTRVKFNVYFGSAVDTLTTDDITIKGNLSVVGGSDKVDYLVKDVTLAADKKSATVEVFYAFNDGVTYDVTVKGYDTESFVASNGAPKSVVLHSDQYDSNKRTVLVDKDTDIWATLYDVNGIDVTTDELRSRLSYTIKYVDSDYETFGSSLYFTEAGERAIVTAEYHTYEYDENSEEKDAFTSTPYTFVAVDKAQTLVERIDAYTTNGNIWNVAHDIKMESAVAGNQLIVRIKLTDDKNRNVDLVAFGQEIVSKDEKEVLGEANFTSLTPDIVEVYDNARTNVELYARKEGTGRVLVSYVYYVNDCKVETAIGIVEVKVLGAPTLTYVTIEKNSVDVCTNPAENDVRDVTAGILDGNPQNVQQIENQFIRVQIAHQHAQYDDNYDNFSTHISGENEISEKVARSGGVIFAEDVRGEGGWWKRGIVVDNAVLDSYLDELEKTAATFKFVLTVTDDETEATKSVKFTVNARKALDKNDDGEINAADATIQVVTNYGDLASTGNNIARVNTYSDNSWNWATEDEKVVYFSAYYVNNKVLWDEVAINGPLPCSTKATDLAEALDGGEIVTGAYYYVVNKNGKAISKDFNVDAVTSGAVHKWPTGSGTDVKLTFSKDVASEIDPDKMVTSYLEKRADGFNTIGAGNYEYILYRIDEVTNGVKATRVGSSGKFAVTCDLGGTYKLTKRNAVSVDVDTTNTADGEVQAALLNCFSFTDREGVGFNSWDVNDNGTVKFQNNETRPFQVNLNAEAAEDKADTVYVESVTFWELVHEEVEAVEDDPDTEADETVEYEPEVYAEYTVKVGCFVTLK